MEFLSLANQRRSIRAYKPLKVEQEKINLILESGRIAPTAANLQPVKVLAVQSEENLAKLGKSANIYGAPLALIVLADHSSAWTRPFDKKQTTDIDASIVTDHMMLQAESLGLGSVWVCFFKPDVLKKEFDIPENFEPINILAIGYSAENNDVTEKQRKSIESFVAFEHL
ncbi:MAG: nitroreductase family protein [Hominimerdicola sp.]